MLSNRFSLILSPSPSKVDLPFKLSCLFSSPLILRIRKRIRKRKRKGKESGGLLKLYIIIINPCSLACITI